MKVHASGKLAHAVLIGCLLILALGLVNGRAAACTWSPPTPWFITKVALVASDLPSTVEIQETDEGGLRLINNLGVSMWIPADFTYPESPRGLEIPPGKSAVFSETLSSTDIAAKELLWIDVPSGSRASIQGKLQTRNRYGDNRPPNPKIPEPQTIALRAEIAQQQSELQLRITYQSNPDYQPVTLRAYDASCSGWLLQMQLMEDAPYCGFLLLAVLIGVSVITGYRRRAKKSDEPAMPK